MTDTRPPPQSTVQAAGRVAEDVVAGLKGQPAMLGLILLNIIGVGAALWFLNAILHASHEKHVSLMKLCFPTTQVPIGQSRTPTE